MPANPSQGQRLPDEIILAILKQALVQELWRLPQFFLINRDVRAGLLHHRSTNVHIYSQEQFENFIRENKSSSESRSATGATSVITTSPSRKGLFMHFMQQSALIHGLIKADWKGKEEVETLAIRVNDLHGLSRPDKCLGLWACVPFRNLRRLYVDFSMLPPMNLANEEDIFENDPDKQQFTALVMSPFYNEYASYDKIEALAISVNIRKDFLHHLAAARDHLPQLRRLYLFTHSWWGDIPDRPIESLSRILSDFDKTTRVKLVVNITIQKRAEGQPSSKKISVATYPNGLCFVDRVVVEQMHADKQDVSGLMHCVIDDVDREWAPDSFDGCRWTPDSAPRYVTGIARKKT